MKTTQSVRHNRNGKVNQSSRQAAPVLSPHPILLSPPRTERSRIQWPTGQQMRDVSRQLVHINRAGRRSEKAGDYFKSGDLAFQMQEIIRGTAELFKKTQRTRT